MTAPYDWFNAGYQAFLADDLESEPYSGFRGAHIDWHAGWVAAEKDYQMPEFLDRDEDGLEDDFNDYRD